MVREPEACGKPSASHYAQEGPSFGPRYRAGRDEEQHPDNGEPNSRGEEPCQQVPTIVEREVS